jgi:hypothetical protein
MNILVTIVSILAIILVWFTPSLEKKILIIFIFTIFISIIHTV